MATPIRIRPDFDVRQTRTALGPNLAQQLGRLLWLPMLVMALMAFPVALVLAFVRAAAVADAGSPVQAGALGQFEVAAMFLGFATVFAAISFAIARILGVLRKGGGEVQETAGRAVQTLKMPLTGWLFLGLMMMAMMMILGAVAVHIVLGVGLLSGSAGLSMVSVWSEWLEGLRRLGASTYLLAIALGLATIVRALQFQSVRLRELPREPHTATQPVA
jgi:hypothetical protein